MSGHKILIIRFSSLGDVILTIPVYRNLKNFWPDCLISAAVKERYSAVLRQNPYIDDLIELKERESLCAFIRRVREKKFDIVIDLHNNLRSNLIALLSGAPKKISYRKAFLERRLFVKRRVSSPELERHTLHRYLESLKKLGMTPQFYMPEISVQPGVQFRKEMPPFRVLVIQTAFLGDAVLTTPVFEALRKSYPSCKISLLCSPEIEEVFRGNANLDEILVMDKRNKDKGFFSLLRWAQVLRGRFDVAILPHRSFRSAFLAWRAGIPKRIGFNISQGKFLLTDTVHFDWKTHDSERNLKLLEALGIQGLKAPVSIAVPENGRKMEKILSEYKILRNDLLVGMNPGSVWNTKRWLPERFAELADKLIEERNCKVILFGSMNDSDAVKAVSQNMKHPALDLCGKTDLKTLSYLISLCSLFITNDSGPMHLACAAGVPVVALFGPTTRELGFFPLGEKSVVVEVDLPCRPCTLHGGRACPLGHFKCMKELTTEMVLQPCREFLAQSPKAGP